MVRRHQFYSKLIEISVEESGWPSAKETNKTVFIDLRSATNQFVEFISPEAAEFLALALLAELKDQGYTLGGGSHER